MDTVFANNGIIFILHTKSESASIRRMRKKFEECGVVPIECEDPKNFRFITPEVVRTESASLDLISRLALKYLGSYSAREEFVKALQKELCETGPKIVVAEQKGGAENQQS